MAAHRIATFGYLIPGDIGHLIAMRGYRFPAGIETFFRFRDGSTAIEFTNSSIKHRFRDSSTKHKFTEIS